MFDHPALPKRPLDRAIAISLIAMIALNLFALAQQLPAPQIVAAASQVHSLWA